MNNIDHINCKVEEEIVKSYESFYRLAFTYVRNKEDALDIVQESICKALKNAYKIKQEDYIKTWISRIVIHTAFDYLKKQNKECSIDEIIEEGKEDNDTNLDLYQALDKLKDKEKTVILLKYFEGYKLEEIAEILQENTNTIKSMLYRSIKKLKLQIGEDI